MENGFTKSFLGANSWCAWYLTKHKSKVGSMVRNDKDDNELYISLFPYAISPFTIGCNAYRQESLICLHWSSRMSCPTYNYMHNVDCLCMLNAIFSFCLKKNICFFPLFLHIYIFSRLQKYVLCSLKHMLKIWWKFGNMILQYFVLAGNVEKCFPRYHRCSSSTAWKAFPIW